MLQIAEGKVDEPTHSARCVGFITVQLGHRSKIILNFNWMDAHIAADPYSCCVPSCEEWGGIVLHSSFYV